MAYALIFTSCNKEEIFILKPNEEIVLGKKLEIPHTVENMQKALKKVSSNLKSNAIIQTTDYYVRFRPSTPEELEKLRMDLNLLLFTYPLDYEFTADGDYYNDPNIDDDQLQWYYTVVPVNFNFPDVNYEILENAFLYHQDRVNQFNEAFYDDLELESELLTNNISEEEYNQYKAGTLKKKNARGCITAEDNVFGRVPLKGIKIKAQNFLNISYTFTNSSGCFVSPNKYKTAKVTAIATDNLNNRARGATLTYTLLDVLENINHLLGNYNNATIDNIQFNFQFGNVNTVNRKKWVAFTVIDAFWDFNNIASSTFNINQQIKKTNTWVSNTSSSGFAAPCLNALHNDGSPFVASTVIGGINSITVFNFLLPGLSGFAILHAALINTFKPDFFMMFNSNRLPNEYRQTIYHEFSHIIEYKKVGVNYWEKYIVHIVNNGGYGNGTQPNAGMIAVMESWAEDFSLSIANVYYENNTSFVFLIINNGQGLITLNSVNEFRRGCSEAGNGVESNFIRHGYYYDLQDELWANIPIAETVLWTQNPPFPAGYNNGHPEYFAGWTYKVQYDALNANVRSYQNHRDAMWQIQTPTTFTGLNINNVLNYIVEQHCTQTP